jgi:nucleotide-binding universal stress UspA family protein
MSRCLALGYDRTHSTRRAARWAVGQLLNDGKLVIVYGCRPLHASPTPLSRAQERRLGRALVDELLLEGEDSLFDRDVEVEVVGLDPVSALSDAALRHRAEAIVVGSESHSRLHTAVGAITGELLKRSPVPVVVVPQTATLATK